MLDLKPQHKRLTTGQQHFSVLVENKELLNSKAPEATYKHIKNTELDMGRFKKNKMMM